MSANDNWFFPSGDQSWDVLDEDRFSEDSTIQNVSDSSIWTFPHLFEFELLNSGLIRSDGCTLDSDFTLFDSLSSIDGHLIVGLVAVLNSEIEVLDGEIKEREDEFIFD